MGESAPYRPIEVKDGKTAMHAVMSIFINHSAEVFHGVVDAISDHYKIPKDEMMDVILSHPAYTDIMVNPILNDLFYLRPEAAAAQAPAAVTAEPKPKKKYVVKNPVAPSLPEAEGKAEQPLPKKFQPKKVAAKPV